MGLISLLCRDDLSFVTGTGGNPEHGKCQLGLVKCITLTKDNEAVVKMGEDDDGRRRRWEKTTEAEA